MGQHQHPLTRAPLYVARDDPLPPRVGRYAPWPPRRRLASALGTAAGASCLALALLYLWCPVHRFPSARAFRGRRWYNPYATVASTTMWQKTNLHVHSHAWRGLTRGRGAAEDVSRRYQAMGYDVAPISNYQEISRSAPADPSAVTVYEQGYNLRKVHFLAIGAEHVDWLDYPLLQGRDEEQQRIDRLRASGALVVIAHPRLRRAITDGDLRALTGYTAIEIGSNLARGEDAWNVALDAGRPVWAVANDDTHNAASPNEAGRYWSMVAAPRTGAAALRAALAAGRSYAVFGRGGHADVFLAAFTLVGDTLTATFEGAPAELRLVGPYGQVLAAVARGHSARWVIPCDAPWVRVVARTATTRLYLQPLLRSEDGALPHVDAAVAPLPTLVRRVLAIVLALIATMAWVGGNSIRLAGTNPVRPRVLFRDAA